MYELASAAGILDPSATEIIAPRAATYEELSLFHDKNYISAIEDISSGISSPQQSLYGFGPGDNPAYPGIFEAQALAAGGTMVAQHVSTLGTNIVFAPAGGLHHAMPKRASGFCVFNDPVIAIKTFLRDAKRVLYVDIDCHHGDAVQYAFYNTPEVMTISLHESGRFLFPGTGFVGESGQGKGRGYSVNLPLAPYTDDGTYSMAFEAVVPPLIKAFKPDVLFTQLGIDTHYRDPITHLRLTTQGFTKTVSRLAELSAQSASWIATGGGGYDLSAVARGWSMALAVMVGADIPNEIPKEFQVLIGNTTFEDETPDPVEPALAQQMRRFAERSVEDVYRVIFPHFGLR